MPAILLFAHGARDPAWAQPFEAIAQQMRAASPGHTVALAFLELMQPSLDAAVAALVQAGHTEITVVPVFLGAGGHVKRDLPALMDQLRALHPQLQLQATCAIGESPRVVAALAEAALGLATLDAPALP
jgi:sirohydrochlorin cobaltochelatase